MGLSICTQCQYMSLFWRTWGHLLMGSEKVALLGVGEHSQVPLAVQALQLLLTPLPLHSNTWALQEGTSKRVECSG